MRALALAAVLAAFLTSSPVRAEVRVTLDAATAKAVLDALADPSLTPEAARRVAALPGAQGLIRKAISYGRPADADSFAAALTAAAHHDGGYPDPSHFQLNKLKTDPATLRALIAAFEQPGSALVARVRTRLMAFSPPGLDADVTGYLVVGGTSGGFAFGEPKFYLNLDYFPERDLAAVIMAHELFHAVQGAAAQKAAPASAATKACLAKLPFAQTADQLLAALEEEGTATYVGDLLALPAASSGAAGEQRRRFAHNLDEVSRGFTLLDLSSFAVHRGARTGYDSIYALGFYGDEIMYPVGYVMTRAIVAEDGAAGVAALLGRPSVAFVQRYRALKAYGRSKDTPALGAETLALADALAACEP